jgi:hypothetical protein
MLDTGQQEIVARMQKQIDWLSKTLQQVQAQLDQTRRRIGLSGIIDDQVISINARLSNGGDAA